MVRRIAALLVALLCLCAPTVAFAQPADLTTAITPAAAPTLSVTYPYADADDDGQNDFVLEVGKVANFFKLTYSTPMSVTDPENGSVTATFSASKNVNYFYRVSNAADRDVVTYGGYENFTTDCAVEVTLEDMRATGADAAFDKDTVVRGFERNPYDTGDLYLSADPSPNASGQVELAVGKSFSLYPLRCWFPIDNESNQLPIQPDYHVKVVNLDAGAVTASESTVSGSARHKWTITGKKAGTALVMVTYDALVYAGAMGDYTDFSAVWPENTGLLVVTVGQPTDVAGNFTLNAERNAAYASANAEKANSMTYFGADAKRAGDALDAELDVLYYTGSAGASYTFAPEAGAEVSVARGSVVDGALHIGEFTQEGVSADEDGTVTVSGLMQGKHVIRVQKDGDAVYQVVRARAVNYKIYSGSNALTPDQLICDSAEGVVYAYTDGTTPITRAAYDALAPADQRAYAPLAQPGGKVTIRFDTVYHPANKFPHCYNMTAALSLVGADGTSFDQAGVSLYGGPGQYAFASTESCQKATLTLPASTPVGIYELGGTVLSTGYGYDGYGSHRLSTYENGRASDGSMAPAYSAHFGQLPKMALDVVEPAEGSPDADAAAQQDADAFEALVAGIGAVDLEATDRIAAARAAYESLSEAALALVDPDAVAQLQQAEERLVALQNEHFTPIDIAEDCVRVIVRNDTWSTNAGAPWDGVLIDVQVDLDSLQDNITTLLDKALDREGMLAAQTKGDYVNAIEGLGDPGSGEAYDGDTPGWMITLNGWFIDAGPGSFEARRGKVRAGDEVSFLYTREGGADLGSFVNYASKDLASLATDAGKLVQDVGEGGAKQGFDSAIEDYTLELPEGTTCAYVKAAPKNQNWQVRTYLDEVDVIEAGYRCNDAIPVQDGSEIWVVVGDPFWTSMSTADSPAKRYHITVRLLGASPGSEGGATEDEASDATAAAARSVAAAIGALPPIANVTDADAQAVARARAAYNALSAAQKKLVSAQALARLAAAEQAVATTVTLNTAKVTKSTLAKLCKKAGKKPASIKKIVLGKKVKRIAAKAFAACKKATVLVAQTKKLTKSSVKGALKGSKVKTVQVKVGAAKVNKKYVKKYRKLFTKKACGRKAAVK